VRRRPATAKLNLALVVGPRRPDGKHEVTTVLQGLDFADRVSIDGAPELRVTGFRDDTLVTRALRLLAEHAGIEPRFAARIEKRIPVGSGLGGGSSDAATALRLANETLEQPLDAAELEAIGRNLGVDVAFFLRPGPQLGEGDGATLTPLDLPQDYWVVLVMPNGERKVSSGAVYEQFDARGGPDGYAGRQAALLDALGRVRRPRDLAALPANDLASSPLTEQLATLGAFRADVSGAGPAVYGLFHHRATAEAATRRLRRLGRTWLSVPAWYV
jgi:4-diphosphocytidyl-2-C-methyl-D-erythritol kinase